VGIKIGANYYFGILGFELICCEWFLFNKQQRSKSQFFLGWGFFYIYFSTAYIKN